MTKQQKTKGSAPVVVDIARAVIARAHGLRVKAIKDWFARQHMRSDADPAAVICIVLQADGQLEATGLGIEPENRQHLAAELLRMAYRLDPTAAGRRAA
jgi:hypothetical protein